METPSMSEKQVKLLITGAGTLAVVATAILLIDMKIKNDILAKAAELEGKLNVPEPHYVVVDSSGDATRDVPVAEPTLENSPPLRTGKSVRGTNRRTPNASGAPKNPERVQPQSVGIPGINKPVAGPGDFINFHE